MEIQIDLTTADDNDRNSKIKRVLKKFLDPNFKVKNDVYLNLFLTHLTGKSSQKGTSERKEISPEYKDDFCEWLIKVSKLWGNKIAVPPSTILTFALNLASKLSGEEQVFVKLNAENVYESLTSISQNNLDKDASVTLGLVTLLCAFLDHKSGVQWVLATTYWTYLVKLGKEAHTMYIRKKTYNFVAKLLEKTVLLNANFCSGLAGMLIKPLEDALKSLPQADTNFTSIASSELFESLKLDLIFLSEVLEILLKEKQLSTIKLFTDLNISEVTRQLLLISQIEDFSFELIKILCIILFSKLPLNDSNKKTVRIVAQDSNILFNVKTLFDLMQSEMDRNHVRGVIKICHFAQTLYFNVAGDVPLCIRKNERIEFQNQMTIFQIMPLLIKLKDENGIETLRSDVFMQDFIHKIVKLSAIRTVEICFKWKQQLSLKPDLLDDMTFTLQYVAKSKNLLNKERAAIFFHPLVWILRDQCKIVEAGHPIELTPSQATFIYTLIETMIDLVQSFDLTWKDSLEAISVLSIAFDFLKYPFWSQKLVISGLRLLNLSISKYMSPDMVLLMDNPKDTILSQTGSLLYAKCHDGSWEIRDSAVETVYALSLNAVSKFPSFTNILLEAQLPQLMIQMATKDGEFYVRASAFRCLQELVKIQDVWDVLLTTHNFLNNILDVFENETEGVVRKEAAALISNIHKCEHFPLDILPRAYDVMTHAIVGDLHWEVKYNAIDFWVQVMTQHLTYQGMIDCDFPTVTFSKEQKKIVTLNQQEIKRRVVKALNQLAHVGCLYAFKHACLDDCDSKVYLKAAEMCVAIETKLKSYRITSENIDLSEPPSPLIEGPRSQPTFLPSPRSAPGSISSTDSGHTPSSHGDQSPNTPGEWLNSVTSPGALLDTNLPFSPITPPSSASSSCTNPSYQSASVSDSHSTQKRKCSNASNKDSEASHTLEENDELESIQFEPMEACTSFDADKTEAILEDLLNSTDMAFLQQIYNPGDKVKNTASQIRKATYLAPSKFVTFIYENASKIAAEKTKWLDSLDEFDSLLDDILSEYNVVNNVNSMDCY